MDHELIIGKYTLESLTNGMYTSPLDMYREYIQNAVDSFDEAITQGIELPEKLSIDIQIDSAKKRIVIRDNGCGINVHKAIPTLLDIGNSRKSRFTARGFRGIGRLAGLSYCEKLIFKTSCRDENCATVIEFNAALLKQLLLPNSEESVSVEDVINRIVSLRVEKETAYRRYFEVILEGVWNETGLTDAEMVYDYLLQHAPLRFAGDFKWGRTVVEKMRISGYKIPEYKITVNNKDLYKPYRDSFISDRVKRNEDLIKDVEVQTFYRGDTLAALLWYAKTNFYGTIIDNSIKGIRVRQGNILIGDKGTCNYLFKEERFNGWMIGELHVVDNDIIANSRRDGFEKNAAYDELMNMLKEWASGLSKDIRHISYERSLSSTKKAVAEADKIDEVSSDINDLFTEDIGFTDDYSESAFLDESESDELAETDYITKLGIFLNQQKRQTKYAALNLNDRLTMEQRKVLERVFDLITQEYEKKTAERFVDTISRKF